MNDRTPHPLTGFIGFPPSGHMNCPDCDYPLQGLPTTNRCPECGFRYDEQTKMWTRTAAWRKYVILGLIILLCAIDATLLWQLIRLSGSLHSVHLLIVLLCVYPLYSLLRQFLRECKYPRRVLTGPDSLVLSDPHRGVRRIHWLTINHFEEKHRFGGTVFTLILKSGETITLPTFLNTVEYAEVAAAIQSRLKSLPSAS